MQSRRFAASATPVLLRKYWLEIVWLTFAGANVVAILVIRGGETVPFHFIFLSFTLLYCLRPWPMPQTIAFVLLNALVTGIPLYLVVRNSPQGLDELTEVPLMTAIFAVVVWHVRRRQQALEELRRSAARERGFIRDASHVLRTPITVARGHAELISNSLDQDELRDDLEIVLEELRRLSRISSRLLLMAKADEPRSFFPAPVDIGGLVRSLLRRWSATAPRRWEARTLVEGMVFVDEEQLTLALDELIENAIKSTVEGDTISIVSRAQGDVAVLEIEDSGRGVRLEDRERIFERFARFDSSTNGNRHDGVGLGLAIVRAIIEANDGEIDVQSSPGNGAKFTIRLPGFARAPRRELSVSAVVEAPSL